MNVLIDGTPAGQFAFASTGAFDVWANASIELTLGAGSHTVRLANVGNTGPNLDRVIVTHETTDRARARRSASISRTTQTADATRLSGRQFPGVRGARRRPLLWLGHRGFGDRRRWHARRRRSAAGYPATAIQERSGTGTCPMTARCRREPLGELQQLRPAPDRLCPFRPEHLPGPGRVAARGGERLVRGHRLGRGHRRPERQPEPALRRG